MKFGCLIEYKKHFFEIHAENEVGGVVPDCSLFFLKTLYEAKANDLQLSFNIFR